MKVAFATKDGISINDHFGWAKKFAVYSVTRDGFELVQVNEAQEDHDEEEDKIASKINAIKDCSIMYCEEIGPTAAAKVVKARIHPIKVKEPKPIEDELKALQAMLQGNPPPWIKRIIAREEGLEAPDHE